MLTIAHASFGGARLAISLQALHMQASALMVGLLMSLMMVVPALVARTLAANVSRSAEETGRPTS